MLILLLKLPLSRSRSHVSHDLQYISWVFISDTLFFKYFFMNILEFDYSLIITITDSDMVTEIRI